MGPSIIFDKSALQSFSVDETVWLDRFFMGNITPLFYIETLADLEKKIREGQTAESIVGLIAAKSPPGAVPNVHHQTMILQELAGAPHLLMDTRPVLAGGVAKRSPEGKTAIDFDGFPEAEALDRWRSGEFLEVERGVARAWRSALASHDVEGEVAMAANLLPRGTKISDLAQLKNMIDQVCLKADKHLLDLLMELLDIPGPGRPKIQQRWADAGSPVDLSVFAPYSTHVFKVNLLYLLGVARGFISGDRASNQADMAYLYYLPFCMVFTSGDGLHKRTVPLFLGDCQLFIPAKDLKDALSGLDAHFDALPDSVKQMEVMRCAGYPPSTLENEVRRCWDLLMRPDWRDIARQAEKRLLDPAYPDEPLESAAELNAMHAATTPMTEDATNELALDDADMVFVKKSMPLRRGKWTMLPPSITGRGDAENHKDAM
jgi:hypothetical protein